MKSPVFVFIFCISPVLLWAQNNPGIKLRDFPKSQLKSINSFHPFESPKPTIPFKNYLPAVKPMASINLENMVSQIITLTLDNMKCLATSIHSNMPVLKTFSGNYQPIPIPNGVPDISGFMQEHKIKTP